MESTRYAIIGAGAIGCYYGGLLQLSGRKVHFLALRSGELLRRGGIMIESATELRVPQPHVHDTVESMPLCDVALVCLKTTANHLLPRLLPPILGDSGIAVLIQNGLEIDREAAQTLGRSRVIIGISYAAVTCIAPGRVHHHAGGRMVLGLLECKDQPLESLRHISDDLKDAGIPVTVAQNLLWGQWRKLLWNIPFNALSVINDAMPHDLVSNPSSRARIESIMQEIIEIASACGCSLERPLITRLLEETRLMPPYTTSMKADYERERPLEVETIIAAPLREAAKRGVAAPELQALHDELGAMSAGDPNAVH